MTYNIKSEWIVLEYSNCATLKFLCDIDFLVYELAL